MNIKKAYITSGLLVLTLSAFVGCNKQVDSNTVFPTTSESLLAVEIPEPEAVEESGDNTNEVDTTGANGTQGSIEGIGDSEFVEGTALTQEELDELLSTFTADRAREGIEAYEAIVLNGESYKLSSGAIVTNAVGKPGDTSWRQMTDEEAKAALDANPNDLIAYGEAHAGEYNSVYDQTIYYNPYEYVKAINKSNEAEASHLFSEDILPFELVEPEIARRGYKASGYTDEEIDQIFEDLAKEYGQ